MADKLIDPRCHSRLRQWKNTSDDDNRSRRKKPRPPITSSILFNLLLIFVLVVSLLNQPVEPARTINACRKQESNCEQATPRLQHVQVRSSKPRSLSSDANQFNVPAATSRGRDARRSPPSPAWTNSGRYNASAHEVPSGPNPISNR